jgi:drug/metabolite transporter (DMT)-like permease
VLSVVLALGSAAAWGVSDFLGGLNSRVLPILAVLAVSQVVGCVLLVPVALATGPPRLDGPSVAFAVAGSASGLVGIAGLYRGMAVGTVSIVAPISATGAALPVIVGVLRGERATPLQTVGIVLALVGIVLASRSPEAPDDSPHKRVASGVGFALLAALGFGGFFVLLHEASTRDVLWAATIQRVTGVCIVLLLAMWQRQQLLVGWRWFGRLAPIGALDTGANVLYAYASVVGLVSLAAVMASLFPVVTVILARIVLNERLAVTQTIGVACALVGVAFIAAQTGYADAPV